MDGLRPHLTGLPNRFGFLSVHGGPSYPPQTCLRWKAFVSGADRGPSPPEEVRRKLVGDEIKWSRAFRRELGDRILADAGDHVVQRWGVCGRGFGSHGWVLVL